MDRQRMQIMVPGIDEVSSLGRLFQVLVYAVRGLEENQRLLFAGRVKAMIDTELPQRPTT